MTAKRTNRAPLTSLTPLPNGWVQAEGYLPIGVIEYSEVQVPDGRGGTRPRRELLPPEEFCKPEVMDLFRVSPVLVGHPRTNGGLVDTRTARGAMSGVVRELVAEEGRRRITLVIHDQAAIDGLPEQHQLSDGYEMDEDFTPGVWEGQPYDLAQRNIRPNHIALVDRGRAGQAAALRLNSAAAGEPMKKPKIRVNGRDYEVPEGLAQALISSRRLAYKPRRPRVNAKGDAAAGGGDATEGGTPGTTTISAGGTDYEVPTELVMALVAGLALTVTVGDQAITGAFCSDAQADEPAEEEMTPDSAPASVPMALNEFGAGRRGAGRPAPDAGPATSRGNAAPSAAEIARREAHAADRAELAALRSQVDRMELAPVLQRALGARFNAAMPVEDAMREAVIRRWPTMAAKVRTEGGAPLRARFELLQEELKAGNFEELVARGNAAGDAPPQDAHQLAEQANERLKARLQKGA